MFAWPYARDEARVNPETVKVGEDRFDNCCFKPCRDGDI
jgi:hypothetical protein